MTRRDVMSLSLKVLGVYFLCWGLVNVPQTLGSITEISTVDFGGSRPGYDPRAQVLYVIIGNVLEIAVGWVLVAFSQQASIELVREDQPVMAGSSRRANKGLLEVAVAVVGVVLAAFAIPRFFQTVVSVWATARAAAPVLGGVGLMDAMREVTRPEGWAAIAGATVSIIVGVGLIVARVRLAELLYRGKQHRRTGNAGNAEEEAAEE